MKTLSVTMTVDEIREKIVGEKVRIRYQGLPATDEFLKVLRVFGYRYQSKRRAVCIVYFEGGGYLSIHIGDVLEIFEEAEEEPEQFREIDEGSRYES